MATPKTASTSKRRKPAAVQKTVAFTVRMSEEQAAVIKRAAEGRALDPASWIRMVSFEAAKAQTARV